MRGCFSACAGHVITLQKNIVIASAGHVAGVHAGKWARGGWAGSDEQETQIKNETQVGTTCLGN
jgi:hypothetical protein